MPSLVLRGEEPPPQPDAALFGQNKGEKRPRGRPVSTERRALVLDVATREFLARGYAATSLETISRASGVSKVTIRRQFGDKDNLFKAIVRRLSERLSRHLTEIIPSEGKPEVVLRDVASSIYDAFTAPDMIELSRIVIAEARRFPDLAYSTHQIPYRSVEPLVRYVEALIKQGVLRPCDPREAAVHLATDATRGLRFLMEPHPLPADERTRHIKQVVSVFLDGYRRRTQR